MKSLLSITLSACLIIGITACQQEVNRITQQTVDTAAIKASIDSLAGVVQKAHDTKDQKLLASTWAKDGIFIMAGQAPVYGRDAIVSAISNMPPLPPGGKMEIYPKEVQVLSAEWAYVLGVDTLKYTLPGATNEIVETSSFFVLVRKTPEGWQTYRETLTPNQAAGKQD